jgi:hypothetical protein
MIVFEYVPAFSTEKDTGVADGSVCVGPGSVELPALVWRAVVETAIVGTGVGWAVGAGVVWPPPPKVHPAAKMSAASTTITGTVILKFIHRNSVPDYLRILFRYARIPDLMPNAHLPKRAH